LFFNTFGDLVKQSISITFWFEYQKVELMGVSNLTLQTTMHTPYEVTLGHVADFRVEYRFYTKEEGGRLSLPRQGIRSDFWYDHGNNTENQVFMIWPEFENSEGEVILDNDTAVPQIGTARMWIIVPERRPYHYMHIKEGLLGYFREGAKKTAECRIIEIVGLLSNPAESV
jgi:hypothetical protein